jgi:outer membrane receptor protein involved in Fe transport
LSAVYDFGSVIGGDQLRVGAGARYVGERAGNAVNDFDLPSYTVADAFATYDTRLEGQKVKFQLNVKNLFDRTYYTSAASRFCVDGRFAADFAVQHAGVLIENKDRTAAAPTGNAFPCRSCRRLRSLIWL